MLLGTSSVYKPAVVSVIIVCYNNGPFIYDALRSTLSQDYPAIELVVSDDCSEHGFEPQRIKRFIEKYNKGNITNVIVNVNARNYGTVRHLEMLRERCHGEYEISIAADDVWRDCHVISAFVGMFEKLGDGALWIVSQVEMCDAHMNSIQRVFVADEVIRMISERNLTGLLNLECHSCILPGLGSAFRKKFFEQIGRLSDNYCLVEDYSTQLRALRKGIIPYYLDYVTARHRSGGVSHGNEHNNNRVYLKLLADYIHIFENEVLPYWQMFSFFNFCKGFIKYIIHIERYKKEDTCSSNGKDEDKIGADPIAYNYGDVSKHLNDARISHRFFWIVFSRAVKIFAVVYVVLSNMVKNIKMK